MQRGLRVNVSTCDRSEEGRRENRSRVSAQRRQTERPIRRRGQHALDLMDNPSVITIKSFLSSPSTPSSIPTQQWPQPSAHTLPPSPSPHPSPRPPVRNNVASRSRLPLPSARSPLSSFGMTQACPCPRHLTSVAASSVVSAALHLPRKRPAKSGQWKRPKCSSKAAIA
jgi:hypothetical protein